MRRTKRQTIEARVRQGICIRDGCGCESVSRGLCDKHRRSWYNRRAECLVRDRRSFEVQAIYRGQILACGQQRKIKSGE